MHPIEFAMRIVHASVGIGVVIYALKFGVHVAVLVRG